MRLLLSTFGSRGDVEPVTGLAAQVRALGAEAVVCCPPDAEFAALVERAGATLAPAFTSVRQWIADAIANDPPMALPERAAMVLNGQFEALSTAAEGCDAILAIGLFPSTVAARCVAELRGLPYVHGAYCPAFVPSEHHRPLAFPGHPVPGDITDNRRLWDLNAEVMDALFGDATAALRARVGLPPVENLRDHVNTHHPWLAADPVLCPWLPTDLTQPVQTGAWILPDDRPLPPAVEAFLAAGAPPVYLGFGSMPMPVLKAAAQVALEAARAHGRRLILGSGWAGLELEDAGDDALVIGEINQQALFRRVATVVHHGGAGTTHTAARAGAPQVVVPQIADQPYHAGRVAALGVGAAHEGGTLTAPSLTAALDIALAPATAERARALAGQIRTDGARVAATMLLEMAAGKEAQSGS
ncbi:MAG: glycosyl transferase [Caulobacter sp.]|nr:glycosyl transferase [Caulobacter sp.]